MRATTWVEVDWVKGFLGYLQKSLVAEIKPTISPHCITVDNGQKSKPCSCFSGWFQGSLQNHKNLSVFKRNKWDSKDSISWLNDYINWNFWTFKFSLYSPFFSEIWPPLQEKGCFLFCWSASKFSSPAILVITNNQSHWNHFTYSTSRTPSYKQTFGCKYGINFRLPVQSLTAYGQHILSSF